MDDIFKEQLELLKVFIKLSSVNKLTQEQEMNLLKRLLVYSSIHRQNFLLHSFLFETIENVTDGERF